MPFFYEVAPAAPSPRVPPDQVGAGRSSAARDTKAAPRDSCPPLKPERDRVRTKHPQGEGVPVDLRHLVFELGDVWISLVIVAKDRIHRSRADIDGSLH